MGEHEKHLDSTSKRHHDVYMRTTLTLDEDVAHSLREQAALYNVSFKEVVNDALRRGLSPSQPKARRPFKVRPIAAGGFRPGVDPSRLNQLYDQLEIEAFVEKNSR